MKWSVDMNVLREIMAAETDVRYAEMVRVSDMGVSRNFLMIVNSALGDLLKGASELDFIRAKQGAELLVEVLDKSPENAEAMGFDKKAVDLVRRAPKVFWKAQRRIEDADAHLYDIEKAVRGLGIGRV